MTEVGRKHTNALISLESTIDEPIVLERIRLDPPPDENALEILDAFVASDPARSTGGSFDGFPPQDLGRLVPVEGAVIAPRDSASLVIGARLTEPGTGYWKRLFVEFRVGTRKYAVRYDDAYVLCAPAAKFQRDGCANPYDADFDP